MDQTTWMEVRTELAKRLSGQGSEADSLLHQLDGLWAEQQRLKREVAELHAVAARSRTRADGAMSSRLRDALRE